MYAVPTLTVCTSSLTSDVKDGNAEKSQRNFKSL